MPPLLRSLAATLTAAAMTLAGGALAAPSASAATTTATAPAAPTYTVSVGSTGSYATPTDTPATPYLDKDGTFYFQQSAALYGANDPREWEFYTGTDFDSATKSDALSNAVNPANSKDANNDTTWRCNNSPTGRQATFAPSGSGYAQKNYCDLAGVWVDPDTGDWYGLVHNEFTPLPFGDGLHFDAIDYTVSTDQGRTWTIENHAITSPYSTTRGDTGAFPNQTYDYGDGDQRLFVDTASGYFYLYYGSRIIDKSGSWQAFYEHVARAPISAKMAAGSWQKWYDGSWSQPGLGGQESNMVPVDSNSTTGYTPVSGEYNPANTGTAAQQIAAGTMPPTSPLFVMNIAYDAYLGRYIGEPQAVNQDGTEPQHLYATDNLATQKWYPIGDTGGYHTASWYRWFLDSANRTSSTIVGKSFRSYCAFGCSAGSSGEYVNLSIDSSAPAPSPVDPAKTYRIANGSGRVLAQAAGSSATTSLAAATGSGLEAWSFVSDGDGSYRVVSSATGRLLGVGSDSTADRAWGTAPTVTAAGSGGPGVGQQWFVIPGKDATGSPTGAFRLVNRYSGLVLGLTAGSGSLTETTPTRSWTNTTGNPVGGGGAAADQVLTLTATGNAPETVSIAAPGGQHSTVGTAASLQLNAVDSRGKALTYAASGLPAGLSLNTATGLISGTPTTPGTGTVTVTASSATATGSASFSWAVTAALNGAHALTTAGKALDDPNHSTAQGTQLITWTPNGGSNQSWTLTQQSDGSYQLTNGYSQLCLDDSGGSTSAGNPIIQWACTGAGNQRWVLTPVAGGYTIASQQSGLLLTTAGTADGALVTQQPGTGSALQVWSVNRRN